MTYIERVIINQLFENQEYAQKVSAFLDINFIRDRTAKIIIKKYIEYNLKYKEKPTWGCISYEIGNDASVQENEKLDIIDKLNKVKDENFENNGIEWLMNSTESYFQEVSFQKAVLKAAEICNDDERMKNEKHKALEMMKDAIKISFNTNPGREYGSDNELQDQFNFYHHTDSRFPFPNWNILNKIIKGGCIRKKIHAVISGTGVGKCISGDTFIKIRNKKTKKIIKIKIKDFFNMVKNKK